MSTGNTMYPGMVNSPVTELSAAINDTVTSFDVLNGAALPDAPNLATIGSGENAETIEYGAKSGNTLSDVTRGFQGVAASWSAGTKVARNFTAYDYETIRQKLEEAATIPAPIQRGLNAIETTQASGATTQVKGRTLANILGRDGGCESLAPFVVDGDVELSSTQVKSGSNSIKLTSSGASTYVYKDYTYALDTSKSYIFAAWVYIESYSAGSVYLAIRDYGSSTTRYTANASSVTIGSWQLVYAKIPTSNTIVGLGFRAQFGAGSTPTSVTYFDSIRLYELSQSDYDAIGTTITGAEIDEYLPYVDSVQHLRGLSVRKTGKNIIDKWDFFSSASKINAVVETTDTGIRLTSLSSGTYRHARRMYKLIPNKQYTISRSLNILSGSTNSNDAKLSVLNEDTSIVLANIYKSTESLTSAVFTAPEDGIIQLYLYATSGAAGSGDVEFNDLQLELGTEATDFAPRNDDYIHIPTVLASNVDRTITDSYDSATGKVLHRYHVGLYLDGQLPWGFSADYAGAKRIEVVIGQQSAAIINTLGNGYIHIGRKYNGYPLKNEVLIDGTADVFWSHAATTWRIVVSDADSGWTESLNPSSAAIKALMNGWRATANNGTTYTSWVSILDGSAPPTNTEAYVAANKALGWDAWATLDYVLATPVEEQLTGDLGAIALANGGNQVELTEGVVVREKANPELSGAGNYNINSTDFPNSLLPGRTKTIIAIYKNDVMDVGWTLVNNTDGTKKAYIPSTDYDPNAEYYVTYEVLDRYLYTANAIDATLTYQSSLGGAVAQAVQDIADLKTHDGVQDFALDYIQAGTENNSRDIADLQTDVGDVQTALTDHITDPTGAHAASAISATGGTNVQAEIDTLKSSVSDGKSGIAAAITDMGQAAAGTDTFAHLATKIRDISDDANATAAQVLTGRTFYQGGVKRTGTMPDRSGDTAAVSSAVSGTTLRLRASEGYRDGVNDYVTITDADLLPENIRNGVNLLGVTGTLEPRLFAEGSSSRAGGLFTVTGLSFRPKVVVLYLDLHVSNPDDRDYYYNVLTDFGMAYGTPGGFNYLLFAQRDNDGYQHAAPSTVNNITNDGFSVYMAEGTTAWKAFG